MSLTASQRSLISQIEKCEWLSERYKELKCVNAGEDVERRGVISLVFRAHDATENKLVAVKFMDPELLHDRYRVSAFDRETEILKRLSNKKRCLKLIESDRFFDWSLFSAQEYAESIPIKAKFFVTEWIPDDIDDYFYDQTRWSAIIKLEIFRKIILAIESIHAEDIHHRDLKPDNIRSCKREGEEVLIAIDYGTAAHSETENLNNPYESSVGAPAYASPEARSGLAGLREIGHLTDIYALGCMLFEMFNREYYFAEQIKNPNFQKVILALKYKLQNVKPELIKAEWEKEITYFNNMVEPAKIDQVGHSIPESVVEILRSLHSRMVQFDYRRRIQSVAEARRKIDTALLLLKNRKAEEIAIRERRKYRENRLIKAEERRRKLEAYVVTRGNKLC